MSNVLHSEIEFFSVELWREVFDYFNSNDLWYSFRDLNKRINTIIDQTMLHLNFQKQGNYDYCMKNFLPSINAANIRSLKLEKSNEIKHFFSIYSLNSLIQLRLLSLTFMNSFNDNSFQFWNQLSSLKYLQSLKIMFRGYSGCGYCIEEKEYIIRSIFNKDFCPLLKSFIIEACSRRSWKSTIPSLITTTKATNIQHVSIDSLAFIDLIKLLPALQNVKSFCSDHELSYDNKQQQNMTITMPLLSKCIRLHLHLSEDMTFEHVEYLLKHTPNLQDLFLWSWYHLLSAKKWELILSVQCPKLLKLALICTGPIGDDYFHQASNNFQQECATIPFWIERNLTITADENYSGHDYRSDIVIRFNIRKLT
ncbi:unnamed protein product [Rotaria magnacalcarata]|uniref:F-box domain-containing protein n=1 Tax=Rotaria magnacalcarata TaxID=392030 RepID=A0A817A0S6_9BILA|nr:unnamed protein product [Rotaria magnacalcarata]CAF2262203.1 unnamed protein product [Rotaria magnacalcarata]CAF4060478.1 unnamed protein product [Rotaria magnacalcarata]CAF4381136.1 unnamed protein product [Rotaria magnacalcarata]